MEMEDGPLSRRQWNLQQDGQMVGDAAGVAGAGVGAEGFLAGMDGVAREQEGDSEDPHSRERG